MPQVYAVRKGLVLLLCLSLLLVLAACGDATPTVATADAPGAAIPATATPTVEVPVPTATPTTAAATTPATLPTVTPMPPTPVPTTAPARTVAASPQTPTVRLSESNVQVGGQVTVIGSGFSANTLVKISGGYPGQPALTLATFISDEQGQFSKFIKLDKLPNGKDYQPGQFTFAVTTSANGTARKVTLNIQEKVKASLSVSAPSVKFGDAVVVSGKSFPANTKIRLMGGVQNPADEHGTATTDAQGNFSIKTSIARLEGANYPEPYHFTAVLPGDELMGYASVTVTDGSENNLYLVLRVLDNQGPDAKIVIVEDVNGEGKGYLVDFSEKPGLTLPDGSTGSFESLKPGNILEFKGAEVPASQRGDVPVIKPLAVRVTQ